jgi:hypothetical protein
MKRYTVNFQQSYGFDVYSSIEVESSSSLNELENEISEITNKWFQLGRLSEEELIKSNEFEGFIKGSFFMSNGESEPIGDIMVDIEETDETFFNPLETEVKQVECSGKWYQGDKIEEMLIYITLSEGVLSGNGVDGIGEYKIHGYLASNYISFNKQYIGKHSILYFGKYENEFKNWQGEWIIIKSGTIGRFELEIPSIIF